LRQVLSLSATLALFGVVFTILHWLILWLGLKDLAALLVFALPVSGYVAYCTHESRIAMLAAAARIYLSFSLVVLFAGLLAYLID